ncbi:MAG: adenylyltransferase/cytidyltransferase family protein, partial [Mariprofundus sp.]|nr:adenylyltransferase/cytidyltransferase family protein [Mariprofundus sp.]
MGMQIGLFGGSFDPPHNGHKALVQAGLAMGMDEIWVIPALPVHRQLSGFADAYTRFDWLRQMFAGEPHVQVVDWEISRQRPTAAIETLRQFH